MIRLQLLKSIPFALAICLGSMLSIMMLNNATAKTDYPVWELIYSHNQSGDTISGSKQSLIDAIRGGKSVRIYWSGRTVEHLTDTFFLTILGGEVFAQIESIQGQNPSQNPPAIELRETQWRAVFSTNGDRALKWFVQQ